MRRFQTRSMTPAPRCLHCRMLTERCICETIRGAAARLQDVVTTRVIVVTHAYEENQTSHTGHLLPGLLPGAEQRWWARRHVAPDLAHLEAPAARAVLLFPAPEAPLLAPAPTGGGPEGGAEQGPLTLVIPDGTWRQARRLAHRHPVLAGLPRVALPPGGPPRWTVRRAHRPDGVCTLEAVGRALGVLHGAAVQAALEAVLVAHDRAIWGARSGAPPRTGD